MNAASLSRSPGTRSALLSSLDPDALAGILDPTVQLAIWRRPRPAALGSIDVLDWEGIDDIDAPIDGPDFTADIARLVAEASYPMAQGLALAQEIAPLAQRFAHLMRRDRLRFRLEVIETDACRKFHMDNVTARLLMPVFGAGTQWIEVPSEVETPTGQLEVGEVAIFKGRRWVDHPAILHRSPPMLATGQTRLLLALDPIDSNAEGE